METSNLKIEKISYKAAMSVVVDKHYLHRKCPCSIAFGLFREEELVGIIVFGKPASYTLCNGIAGEDESKNVIELNRLWVCDSMPKNTESWFIARSIKKCGYDIIVSFADTEEGHIGYVYQATNWLYTGTTQRKKRYRLKNELIQKHGRNEKMSKKEMVCQYGEEAIEGYHSSIKHRYIYLNCKGKRRVGLRQKIKYEIKSYPKNGANKSEGQNSSLVIMEISKHSENSMFTCVNQNFHKDVLKHSKHWFVDRNEHTDYARAIVKGESKSLHRLIMELHLDRKLEEWEQIDHIDGCGLNNSLDNLQVADAAINNFNKSIQKNNTTGYRGVYARGSQNPPYLARIQFRSKNYTTYCYHTKEAAALAFDDMARGIVEKFDFAYDPERVLNFPDLTSEQRINIDKTEKEAIAKYRKTQEKSTFYNLWYDRTTNRWAARTPQLHGKRIIIGMYDTQIDAAKAADHWLICQGLDDKVRLNYEYSDDVKDGIRSGRILPPEDNRKEVTKKYRFTSLRKKTGRWIAKPPNENGKKIEIGSYETEEEAGHASDYFMITHDVDRTLNFSYTPEEVKLIKDGTLKVLTVGQKKKINRK